MCVKNISAKCFAPSLQNEKTAKIQAVRVTSFTGLVGELLLECVAP